MLKAISLHQPYASLVAFGEKMNETRGRKFNHAGELAICSTKNQMWIFQAAIRHFAEALARHGITEPRMQLPFGCVLAVVNMRQCTATTQVKLSGNEELFGDYSGGRYAYEFNKVRRLGVPVPVKGGQFIFHLPPDVEAAVRRELK